MLLAISALRALQEAGIAVPQDAQIISLCITSIVKAVYPYYELSSLLAEEAGQASSADAGSDD